MSRKRRKWWADVSPTYALMLWFTPRCWALTGQQHLQSPPLFLRDTQGFLPAHPLPGPRFPSLGAPSQARQRANSADTESQTNHSKVTDQQETTSSHKPSHPDKAQFWECHKVRDAHLLTWGISMLQVRARLWFIAKDCILLPATYLHVGGGSG